jgi:chaperonin GroEL (HSP60 family)
VIKSASEAAGMILKIDDVIASSRSKDSAGPPKHDGEGGEEGASEY